MSYGLTRTLGWVECDLTAGPDSTHDRVEFTIEFGLIVTQMRVAMLLLNARERETITASSLVTININDMTFLQLPLRVTLLEHVLATQRPLLISAGDRVTCELCFRAPPPWGLAPWLTWLMDPIRHNRPLDALHRSAALSLRMIGRPYYPTRDPAAGT